MPENVVWFVKRYGLISLPPHDDQTTFISKDCILTLVSQTSSSANYTVLVSLDRPKITFEMVNSSSQVASLTHDSDTPAQQIQTSPNESKNKKPRHNRFFTPTPAVDIDDTAEGKNPQTAALMCNIPFKPV